MTAVTVEHDVVIVGYGPVGAVLANLLGRDGLDVAVFEPTHDVYHLPRAAHFDDEVMRVFETLGLAEAMLPVTAPVLGMDFVAADGTTLFGFSAAERPRPHGWETGYMFRQPELERVLRAGVERWPTVQVHLGHQVTALDGPDGRLQVLDLASGAERTVRARYVVGCDGARSLVRKALGISLDDSGFDQPWLVVDTDLLNGTGAGTGAALPERILQICDPARPATFVPSAGRHRRWEFMAVDGETPEELTDPATIARLLAPWVSVGRDVEVVRAAVYSFHALVAREWRRGNVLLAGDAAHQMPPFLGQGMCAGIRDAANLAWKLTLVVRGLADDGLLDTYQSEREPHVRAITDLAVSLGGIIQTTDAALAAERDAGFRSSDGAPPPAGLPRLGPGLSHGDDPAVGRPFPQAHPGDDATLGPGFAIVGPLAATTAAAADIESLGARAVPRPAATTTIVRPDRYTYAVAATPEHLTTALSALRRHLRPR